MDRTVPEDRLKHLNPRFLTGSALADDLPRDYPLNEIAIVTRAGPGWLLGLRVAPDYDDAVVRDLRKHFEAYSTVSFDNYPERACRTLRW